MRPYSRLSSPYRLLPAFLAGAALAAMLSGAPALGAPSLHSCLVASARNLTIDQERLSEVLRKIPAVKAILLRFLQDPDMPAQAKAVLAAGLNTPGITVDQMASEIAQALDMAAAYSDPRPPFSILLPEEFEHASNSGQWALPDGRPRTRRIRIADHPSGSESSLLLSLVHECAHARMMNHLERILPRLSRTYPGFVLRAQDGRFAIHSGFYELLQERYAWGMEFETLKALHGRYTDTWPKKFGPEDLADGIKGLSRKDAEGYITLLVNENYPNIMTDPAVAELNPYSLQDILRGKVPTHLRRGTP